ncbi:hypothetical protein A3B45_00145 [Candidatus Daviesbacteria bacterium RIFCSPLOWO2_01_FULL_39_12]|uniref:Glycosyl transferase family 1 n=1 Tax=Candidatus Daviesbacteria bacterium RIFCSPLOWO2_01_FULL_39_12 TaxID=1797785 RepID=A0A1F5KNW3_9BACT|nr:MAG: hypothetical protein A3B45_00145 [Candidatus Daviesbacteria bacterium RIFCSPLOWO2_01_FULL_39_12]
MRIIIDARMYQESGVGRYIRNLIDQLQILDKFNEYYILHLLNEYDKLVYHTKFNKVLTNFNWYGINEQIKLPKILNQLNPDLVHFPHFNMPVFYKGKFVVTIHDLIHQHFQMKRATTLNPILYKVKQFGYKAVFKKAIKNAQKILVPSNYVKDLLVKQWEVDGEKIIVTYEAVDDKVFSIGKLMKKNDEEKMLHKFNIKPPYIFYVGNAHPHKNVEGLIKALLRLKENYPNLILVLSGQDHYFWQRIKRENQYDGIIYTGYVSDEQLVALYKNASCFVMPSFEEGFGIPLLEAMASGCPVVSSNAGALKEVGGDAAIYFDPHNMDDMTKKISQVLNSEKLRKELTEKGLKRYKQFSWEKLAKQTLEVYSECV